MEEVIGRPVDVDVVPRAHAILSASSAERWITCTPSARLEETMPDRGSSFASDGTAAHAFAELRLRHLLKQITKPEYLAGYRATKLLHAEPIKAWEPSDWEAINTYVDYVMAEAKRLDATVYIEQRVDYSKYAQDGFGTSDALLVSFSQKIIKSIDLKFGKGVPVSATNNTQAKIYALGGLLNLDPTHLIDSVEWAIVQPRLDYTGEDSMSAKELIKWAEEVVAPAAKLAWEGKGKLVTSPKGCQFCKVRATCRARVAENVLIARKDFMKPIDTDEHLMGMDEVARILPDIDGWISWANQLKSYALEQVRDHDAVVPGYKLVRGRANRAWKGGVDIADSLRALAVSETDIFVSPEPSVRSVAQLEKQLGKKEFAEKIAIPLVVKPLGTPALVPDEDPRESMNKAAEAKALFGLDK